MPLRIPGLKKLALVVVGIFAITALLEHEMGRSFFGSDGKPGLWEGNIWSSECSQRFTDPYSFTHIGHGLILFAVLFLIAKRLPASLRYLLALLIEVTWELFENSSFIINRYREATIALGYCGDSILNSLSDLLMMSFGFYLAWKLPVWMSLVLFLILEIGCALWVRDNLTLNIIMLIHPVEAIKAWQANGQQLISPH